MKKSPETAAAIALGARLRGRTRGYLAHPPCRSGAVADGELVRGWSVRNGATTTDPTAMSNTRRSVAAAVSCPRSIH
jgi:hypothetical protein